MRLKGARTQNASILFGSATRAVFIRQLAVVCEREFASLRLEELSQFVGLTRGAPTEAGFACVALLRNSIEFRVNLIAQRNVRQSNKSAHKNAAQKRDAKKAHFSCGASISAQLTQSALLSAQIKLPKLNKIQTLAQTKRTRLRL